ncbi:MAG TPA: helix-turn-helix domain-containing protein [Candidatus Thermoplasmatota archaeon]|nr:helix-turn-helix domain-containing protein [Candidatus Thermoplasmatota archaeon]
MLTSVLGDHPEVRVLEFLSAHQEFDYTITDLARHSGVSRPATYKVVSRFLKQGILRKTRKVGASQFYALAVESPLVKPFLDMQLVLAEAPAPRRRRRPAREVSQ